jgi:DNA end-binding protein Ku
MPALGHVYWRGFLRLQLVSINVDVYAAAETKSEISFNQIHKPTGKRIRYEKVVPGLGPVESADIVKGYQVEPEVYVTLEPEEIEAIKLESKKTIDLVQFVDASEIDARYYERPYYIVPKDEVAAEGYLVIRDALIKANKVGLAQITMHGREHLVAVMPIDKGMMMNVIRYENELRSSGKFFRDLKDVKYDKGLVGLASELIARNSAPFDPSKFKDTYAVELSELVKKKARGQKITIPAAPAKEPSNVVNLMDALKKSLGKEKPAKPAKPSPASKRKSAR